MSLRDELIEAGAEPLADNDGIEVLDWHRDLARAVLDAMLDLLTERADEWENIARAVGLPGDHWTSALLKAVKREDR